jgi:hypothetical protein
MVSLYHISYPHFVLCSENSEPLFGLRSPRGRSDAIDPCDQGRRQSAREPPSRGFSRAARSRSSGGRSRSAARRRSVVRKRRSGSLRPTRTLTHPDTCTARSECRPRRLRVSPPESGWSGPHRFRVHPAPRRRVLSGAQGPYRPAH